MSTHPSSNQTHRIPGAEYVGLLVVLAALIVVFSAQAPHFFGVDTLRSVLDEIPSTVVVSVGMTYVLIIAGIDLSVGTVLGLSGAVLGVLLAQAHLPLPLSIAAALAAGSLCGVVNGMVSVVWSIPSFIVTLGMLEIARGAAHLATGSRTEYIGTVVAGIANTTLVGVSLPFLLAVLLVVGAQVVLARTIFGRHVVAVGANEEALRLSGVDPRRIKVIVFTLSGLCSALAAIIDTSRFQSADPNAGNGLELTAIAAVVIGGSSLMGGRGSVIGSFLGVLVVAVLDAGLAALGTRDEVKRLITGCVIVIAVIIDQLRQRKNSEG
jgi:ribose transport system permease protein